MSQPSSNYKPKKTLKEKIISAITYVVIVGIIVALIKFCHNSNSKNATTDPDNDSLKAEKNLSVIATKYHALKNLKHCDFTYQYQQILDSNNRIIIDSFELHDIGKNDSGYTVFIHSVFRAGGGLILPENQSFSLNCNQQQINNLKKDSDLTNTETGYFEGKIFLVVEINGFGRDDNGLADNVLPKNRPYTFTGKIIDIIKP